MTHWHIANHLADFLRALATDAHRMTGGAQDALRDVTMRVQMGGPDALTGADAFFLAALKTEVEFLKRGG